MKEPFIYRDKTALITGASSGIGATFARALAARGTHLILVARTEEKLQTLAQELQTHYPIRCEVIVADLVQPDAASAIKQAVEARNLMVDILINNAGFGTYGLFSTLSPERDQQEVMVNVASVVSMAHTFLPSMVERRTGAIINLASMAAFQPIPYMAVYGASKAFVLSFSAALRTEYQDLNIRVLALCPGPVPTNFFEVAGNKIDQAGVKVSPERVVANTLRALEKNKSYVVPGILNRLTVIASSHLLPQQTVSNMVGRIMKP